MKRTIILLSLIMTCIFIHAQNEMMEKFELSATGNEYGIYMSINCETEAITYDMWFDMQSPNSNGNQEVQAKMTFNFTNGPTNHLYMFNKSIIKAKETYKKWKGIAQSNSLKKIAKKMPISVSDMDMYFTQDYKWHLERGVDMWWTFYVNDDGQCYLILESDYMTSDEVVGYTSSRSSTLGAMSGNTVIRNYCAGANLVFSTEEEIDQFIAKLGKAAEWKRANVENGKLLK